MLIVSMPSGACMSVSISHDHSAHRFETRVDGALCSLDYTFDKGSLDKGVMTITHTGVPAEVGGRGIAAALVQAAMDEARAQGWKVVPACSYAAAWMQRHPEYADLRA